MTAARAADVEMERDEESSHERRIHGIDVYTERENLHRCPDAHRDFGLRHRLSGTPSSSLLHPHTHSGCLVYS